MHDPMTLIWNVGTRRHNIFQLWHVDPEKDEAKAYVEKRKQETRAAGRKPEIITIKIKEPA